MTVHNSFYGPGTKNRLKTMSMCRYQPIFRHATGDGSWEGAYAWLTAKSEEEIRSELERLIGELDK